jgi:hypothetical protein
MEYVMSVLSRGSKVRAVLMSLGMTAVCAVGAYHVFQVTPARAEVRRTVCATDLYVRDAPAGVIYGALFKGQSFSVERYSPSGDWVYGFAYGNVNRHGWVQNGWFC